MQYEWYYDSDYPEDPWDYNVAKSTSTQLQATGTVEAATLNWQLAGYEWATNPAEPSEGAQFSSNKLVITGTTNIAATRESLTVSYRGTLPKVNRTLPPNFSPIAIKHTPNTTLVTNLTIALELLESYTAGTESTLLEITIGTIADPLPNHIPYIPQTIAVRFTGLTASEIEYVES